MRRDEIVEKENRMKSRDCGVDVEPLWILKRKAYKIKMDTSGMKDQWRSETDQDEKGETGKTHLRVEQGSV